jgi:hypothetical protein
MNCEVFRFLCTVYCVLCTVNFVLRNVQRWAPAIFFRSPLPLVRFLEIVLPQRSGLQL